MTGPGTSSTTTCTLTSRATTTTLSAPNTSQACAACKHQRRKCVPDCPLAPYFPPSSHKDFFNTQKLFGVRNIMRTIQQVEPSSREIAVKAMVIQANARARDPVGGCFRIVKDLEIKINQTMAELEFVLYKHDMIRVHAQTQNSNPSCCYGNDPIRQEDVVACGGVQQRPSSTFSLKPSLKLEMVDVKPSKSPPKFEALPRPVLEDVLSRAKQGIGGY